LLSLLGPQVVEASEILAGWRSKLVKNIGDKDLALQLDTTLPRGNINGSSGSSSAASSSATSTVDVEDDGKPRFLQLVVMAPSSNESGRIIYFLINKWRYVFII